MFRVTIAGKDYEEFRTNLLQYAAVHGSTEKIAKKKIVSKFISPSLVEDDNTEEEMEEVQSPYTDSPAEEPAQVAEVPVTNNSGELDAEGFPWDSRIHASSKAKNTNGTWRGRRGVEETLINQVKAELRNRQPVIQPVMTPSVHQASVTPMQPVFTPPPVNPVVTPVVQPIQTPPVAPPSLTTNGHTLQTFKENFALICANLITEGKIKQEYMNQLKAYFGVAEIWMINDDQKAMCFDQWVQYGFIQKVG